MARVNPNFWPTPNWHTQWDGDFVFASLRSFAQAVLAVGDLSVQLVIIEDGYARLHIFRDTTRIGVVYANRESKSSVAQFTIYAGADDEEMTTADISAAVRFVGKHRTAHAD